ncbi:MAG: glycosyltransferase, partial [Deltaproteobacteria bacterium]|nr:glycosyltransferase [Deltaproteobacteria bacterium]
PLPHLYEELKKVLSENLIKHEIIFCDDGSSDSSRDILRNLAAKDPCVKVIFFKRNFGQTSAMDALLLYAKGDVIVPMDADLQNNPADIPAMLDKLKEGYDLVSGWRRRRKDSFLTKTLPSRIANYVVSSVTGVRLHDYGCTLKAYRRDVLRDIRLYGEMHRLIPAYVGWAGGKITEMEVNHRPRVYGKSKYNLYKTIKVILDLITVKFLLSYSTKPIYFIGKWGLLSLFMGSCSLVWSAVKRFIFREPFYTDPFFTVGFFLLMIGIVIIFFGLFAELLMRTYFESQGKRPYLVKETVNIEDENK